ncbi:hypothetical protein NDU88_004812 [Pleurodeles waltl]|uniref:Uncharacterized protein n=1 Tax=Pleurodeles waltl TaxID=8319 RepID=A0AAV7UG60_PLEWA|nr:hypothetical protein NDU88_004812 [Pleurodeles waltl]
MRGAIAKHSGDKEDGWNNESEKQDKLKFTEADTKQASAGMYLDIRNEDKWRTYDGGVGDGMGPAGIGLGEIAYVDELILDYDGESEELEEGEVSECVMANTNRVLGNGQER